MTLDFFLNNYSFSEMEVENVILENGKLEISIAMTSYLELIANGYRPEMNVVQRSTFTFSDVSPKDYIFTKPYIIQVNKNNWSINETPVVINNDNIKIKRL